MVVARDLEYEVDGTTMRGRLAVPGGEGVRPAVLIAHEGPGLDDLQAARAEKLAELGYVAFALDYHGGRTVLTEVAEMNARLDTLMADADLTRRLGRAGLDVLLDEPRTDRSRVAAIGYCFGGTVVLELARAGTDLKAVVGFHPGLYILRAAEPGAITAKVLMIVGAEDPFVPPAQRVTFEAEIRAAGADWQLLLYGGVEHSFTHPWADRKGIPGLRYDRSADERSWRAMLALLDETFADS